MKFQRTLLFMALSGVSSAALAAEMDHNAPAPSAFVNTAAQSGMTEVELGNAALAQSQDATIKAFAERMVADHGKANDELATIAKSKGIEPPTKLDAAHMAMVKSLSAKKGADFDAAYSKHMKMDHTKAVALFESESRAADEELAAFARKTLPTLKEHKEMAAKLPGPVGS